MTSAIASTLQNPPNATEQANASTAASGFTSPLPGAVPAQQPARSYSSAITASQAPTTPAGVLAPSQNGKSVSESPVNGVGQMAQGGMQGGNTVPNGTPGNIDHGRKPSVVISASGTSGYTPNGGPVSASGRLPIAFGSMNSQGSPLPTNSIPNQSQATLPVSQANPRVISPAHSPSPIPQPPASGGPRPPSNLQQSQSNGLNFGSMGGEGEFVGTKIIAYAYDQLLTSNLDAPRPYAIRSHGQCLTHARTQTIIAVYAR